MHSLVPHPSTPASGWTVRASADRTAEGELRLCYVLEGALDEVMVPPPVTPGRGELLWQHTCFEVFVGPVGAAPYHELNLSPAGAWTVYAFRGYRDGGPLPDDGNGPACTIDRALGRIALDARVPLRSLSSAYPAAALRVGLSAVIERRDGGLVYCALRHAPGTPDFHHADAFALRLERPAGA